MNRFFEQARTRHVLGASIALLLLGGLVVASTSEPTVDRVSTDDATSTSPNHGSGTDVAAPGEAVDSGDGITDEPTGVAAGDPDTPGAVGGDTPDAPGAAGAPAPPGAPPVGGHLAGSGTGISDTEIRVGIQTHGGIQQLAESAFGANRNRDPNAPDPADETERYRLVIDHINATGGLAGRKVVPFFHDTDVTQGTFNEQEQRACTYFTEDAKVFVAMTGNVVTQHTMSQCTAQRNTPILHLSPASFDETELARYPAGMIYMPKKAIEERQRTAWVDHLASAGYFQGDTRLGLVRYDQPMHERIANRIIKPRLDRHGQEVVEEAVLTMAQTTAGISATAGQINNAILRFRTQNINRVVFMDDDGSVPFLWMTAAENQGYRPRYGLSTGDFPGLLSTTAPARQLEDAIGLGWRPDRDGTLDPVTFEGRGWDVNEMPGWPPCRKIYADAGVNEAGGRATCEGLFFLRAALAKALELSIAGLRAGAEQLSDSYHSPSVFGTRFGPGRVDGNDAVRPFAWNNEAGHFEYVGPPRRLS